MRYKKANYEKQRKSVERDMAKRWKNERVLKMGHGKKDGVITKQ